MIQNKFHVLAMLVVSVFMASISFAHGKGGEHIKGTVEAVDVKSMTLKTSYGTKIVIDFDEKTQFEHSGQVAAWDHLEKGERVVVHASRTDGGARVAEAVRFGKQPSASPKADAGMPQEGHHGHHGH